MTQKAGCILMNLKTEEIALVYRKEEYSFPKGHLERGETLEECAIRETKEETGYNCHIIENSKIVTNIYKTDKGEDVECYFYFAIEEGKTKEYINEKDKEQVEWVKYIEVENKLKYENLKRIWQDMKLEVEKIINEYKYKKTNIVKNQEYIVEITDNGFEGEGIAKINNFTIFIPGALKGEIVKILIVKVLSSFGYGKIIEILKESKQRQQIDCLTYQRCGGCNLRHIKYEETLEIKQNAVQSLVNKTLKNKIEVQKTIGMEAPFHYRNKAQYPIGINKEGNAVIGVYANRTHEVITIKKCFIQNQNSENIAKFVIEFINKNRISVYNEKTGKGLFRHIVIKVGIKTKQIMCVLVTNGEEIPKEKQLIYELISEFPQIKTIVKNINMKNTNVILGEKNINLYGDGYIEDILDKFTFKISPLSFYQVNPIQAEKLYNLGVEMAQISKQDTVFDLYCGIGTISLFMAQYAKKVYGIEIVDEAVVAARENAKLNEIENTEFYSGDVEIVLDNLINKKGIKADIVMVDPPRKGLDKNSIKNILKIKPKKIVYISCNPATLVRDLSEFENEYDVKKIIPVDMFPWTSSIESCSVLEIK